jgi:queuosine precursor transporter
MIYIMMYLVAIVLANLSSAHFGAGASIVNAFLFIGLDLTSRDKLHDKWQGRGLVLKMGILILSGSLISWLINRNAGIIAIASMIAFCAAAIIDTVIYQLLHKRSYIVKVNGSNIFSALADSLIFPTIAFGGFNPIITLGQFSAKVLGGFLWAIILNSRKAESEKE